MAPYKVVRRRDIRLESEGKVMGYGFKSEKLNQEWRKGETQTEERQRIHGKT